MFLFLTFAHEGDAFVAGSALFIFFSESLFFLIAHWYSIQIAGRQK
jgi:hypothetical protein